MLNAPINIVLVLHKNTTSPCVVPAEQDIIGSIIYYRFGVERKQARSGNMCSRHFILWTDAKRQVKLPSAKHAYELHENIKTFFIT